MQMSLELGWSVSNEITCEAKERSGVLMSRAKGSSDCIILALNDRTLSTTRCRDLKMSNLGFFYSDVWIDCLTDNFIS